MKASVQDLFESLRGLDFESIQRLLISHERERETANAIRRSHLIRIRQSQVA